MISAKTEASFPNSLEKVWETVTSLHDISWRSDLSKVQILSSTKFIEYTKNGYATTFTVTKMEPCKRWEFDMENQNIRGHWTGIFSYENGETTICFTEAVVAKKWFLKPLLKIFLKNQQNTYVSDLQKILRAK